MKDWYFFLFALVLTWTIMMAITFGHLLCRTTFGGVWSSIVIDDCADAFWRRRTVADYSAIQLGLVGPLSVDHV